MKDRVLNIGVLGAANIAERYVLPAIKSLKSHFHLVGIGSRRLERASNLAENFGCSVFDGYEEMLAYPGLDAIYIALPNSHHAKWIDLALDRGVHVLVEKTLACSYEEVIDLNNKAKVSGLTVLENFQFKRHNQMAKVHEILSNGIIGELRGIRSSFGFPPFSDIDNIRYQNNLGGGALLDAGAYTIKVAQIFLGLDISVKAANLTFDKLRGIDLWGGGYISQMYGNLFAEVAFGFDNHYQCSLELWGSKGKILCDRIFTSPPNLGATIAVEVAAEKSLIKLPEDNHFINMLIYFHGLVCTGKGRELEYIENINQSRLIKEMRMVANE